MTTVLGALTPDTVEKLAIGMAVVTVIVAVLVIRSSLKLLSKVGMIVVLGGIGFTIFQNRVELGRCSQTCSCTIYGQEIEVPHLPFSCDY